MRNCAPGWLGIGLGIMGCVGAPPPPPEAGSGDGTTASETTRGAEGTTTEGTSIGDDVTSSGASEDGTSETQSPSPECGNGVVEGLETCDGDDLNGETCQTQGFGSGNLLCEESCASFDVAACSLCGNGVIDEEEACDGVELEGATCESLGEGFDGGTLQCAGCVLDSSQCELHFVCTLMYNTACVMCMQANCCQQMVDCQYNSNCEGMMVCLDQFAVQDCVDGTLPEDAELLLGPPCTGPGDPCEAECPYTL